MWVNESIVREGKGGGRRTCVGGRGRGKGGIRGGGHPAMTEGLHIVYGLV